jgi:hypothetical protein
MQLAVTTGFDVLFYTTNPSRLSGAYGWRSSRGKDGLLPSERLSLRRMLICTLPLSA